MHLEQYGATSILAMFYNEVLLSKKMYLFPRKCIWDILAKKERKKLSGILLTNNHLGHVLQWSLTFQVAALRRKNAKFAWKWKIILKSKFVNLQMINLAKKFHLKPVVDLIQCKLSSAGLVDCLKKNGFD